MTYRGKMDHGVVVLEGEKPADGTQVDVTPVAQGFWQSPSLEELARTQGVAPITDVSAIFGTWPGDPDDGFEAAIDELRHQNEAKRR